MTRAFPCGREWRWLTLVLVLPVVVACSRSPSRAPAAAPLRTGLRLGFTPAEDTLASREDAARALAGYLTRQLDVPVEVVRTASYGPAVQAMAAGEIDLMPLSPFSYILAARAGLVEAIAVTGRPDAGPRTYQSAIVAHRRSGLQRLEDLPARAQALRFDFTDPESNSGHLVPKARLAQLGLVPERDFLSCEFTLSHSVALFNLVYDVADVVGVSGSILQRLDSKGRLPTDDLVVLWRSEPMPNGPFAVRSALEPWLKRDVQQALAALHERDPAAWRAAMRQYPESGLIFLACDDSLFDELRDIAESIDLEVE